MIIKTTGTSVPSLIPIFKKDELVSITRGGKSITTSLMVADKFEKRHKNLIQSIENLECSDEFGRLNFQPSFYINQQNKKQPMFLITRDGFTILAMGFKGKTAMAWKERYIARFNELEEEYYKKQLSNYTPKRLSSEINYLIVEMSHIKKTLSRLDEVRRYSDNPVAPFYHDQCDYKAGSFVLKDDLYDRYKGYCYVKEEHTLSRGWFCKKIYECAGWIKPVKRIVNGKTLYGITGLALKEVQHDR